MIGTPLLLLRFYKTPPGRALLDRPFLMIPVCGQLARRLDTGQFDTDVISVLQAGEETGRLSESLNQLDDDHEEQVSGMIKSLGHLILPLVTVCLGGIVSFIILAVFLPLIQMITSLGQP
jgi:type II secretory pathway component PulF